MWQDLPGWGPPPARFFGLRAGLTHARYEGAAEAWGARVLIVARDGVQFLGDRMSSVARAVVDGGWEPVDIDWPEGLVSRLRAAIRALDPDPRSQDVSVLFDDGPGGLKAMGSPNGSHGYFYVTVWLRSYLDEVPDFAVVSALAGSKLRTPLEFEGWALLDVSDAPLRGADGQAVSEEAEDGVRRELDRRKIAVLDFEPTADADKGILTDEGAWAAAIANGWSLVRVPDAIGSPYSRMYVLDTPEARATLGLDGAGVAGSGE